MSDAGPAVFVQMACLCEHVLIEADGVFSAIRVVDTFNVSLEVVSQEWALSNQPGVALPLPERPPVIPVRANLLVAFKTSSPTAERYQGEFRSYDGAGTMKAAEPFEFEVGPDERGAVLHQPLRLMVEAEGLHHLDVLVDGHLLSRIPYRVNLLTELPTAVHATPANPASKQPVRERVDAPARAGRTQRTRRSAAAPENP